MLYKLEKNSGSKVKLLDLLTAKIKGLITLHILLILLPSVSNPQSYMEKAQHFIFVFFKEFFYLLES